MATGPYNWLRVRPWLGTEHATGHLRRTASAELTIGVLVLVDLTLYRGIGFILRHVLDVRAMPLTIGSLAAAAQVNVQTVRYYERRGLLPTAGRTTAGYRQYDADSITRLRFIKHAQALGFSLREIEELLTLRVRHGGACASVERRTRQKIEVVEQRIDHLTRLKRTLEHLVDACQTRHATDECPVLATLNDDGVDAH